MKRKVNINAKKKQEAKKLKLSNEPQTHPCSSKSSKKSIQSNSEYKKKRSKQLISIENASRKSVRLFIKQNLTDEKNISEESTFVHKLKNKSDYHSKICDSKNDNNELPLHYKKMVNRPNKLSKSCQIFNSEDKRSAVLDKFAFKSLMSNRKEVKLVHNLQVNGPKLRNSTVNSNSQPYSLGNYETQSTIPSSYQSVQSNIPSTSHHTLLNSSAVHNDQFVNFPISQDNQSDLPSVDCFSEAENYLRFKKDNNTLELKIKPSNTESINSKNNVNCTSHSEPPAIVFDVFGNVIIKDEAGEKESIFDDIDIEEEKPFGILSNSVESHQNMISDIATNPIQNIEINSSDSLACRNVISCIPGKVAQAPVQFLIVNEQLMVYDIPQLASPCNPSFMSENIINSSRYNKQNTSQSLSLIARRPSLPPPVLSSPLPSAHNATSVSNSKQKQTTCRSTEICNGILPLDLSVSSSSSSSSFSNTLASNIDPLMPQSSFSDKQESSQFSKEQFILNQLLKLTGLVEKQEKEIAALKNERNTLLTKSNIGNACDEGKSCEKAVAEKDNHQLKRNDTDGTHKNGNDGKALKINTCDDGVSKPKMNLAISSQKKSNDKISSELIMSKICDSQPKLSEVTCQSTSNNESSLQLMACNVNSLQSKYSDTTSSSKSSNVDAPQPNSADIDALQSKSSNVDATQPNSTDIDALQLKSSNVDATQPNSTDIDALQSKSSNVDATQPNSTDIDALQLKSSNVDATQPNSTDIDALQSKSSNVDATQPNSTDIDALQLKSSSVDATQPNSADIDALPSKSSNVDATQPNSTDIDALQLKSSSVDATQQNSADIDALPSKSSSVDAIQPNSGDMDALQSKYIEADASQSKSIDVIAPQSKFDVRLSKQNSSDTTLNDSASASTLSSVDDCHILRKENRLISPSNLRRKTLMALKLSSTVRQIYLDNMKMKRKINLLKMKKKRKKEVKNVDNRRESSLEHKEKLNSTDEKWPLLCGGCGIYYKNNDFNNHKRECKVPSYLSTDGRVFPYKCVSNTKTQSFNDNILRAISSDEIGRTCSNENFIVTYGTYFYTSYTNENEIVLQSKKTLTEMRALARLYLIFKKVSAGIRYTSVRVEDMFQKENFEVLRESLDKILIPGDKDSMKVYIGHLLRRVGCFLSGLYLVENNEDALTDVVNFLELLQYCWSDVFGKVEYALYSQMQKMPPSYEVTLDISELRKFMVFCSSKIKELVGIRQEQWSAEIFGSLGKYVISRLILLNAKHANEICQLTQRQWNEAVKEQWVNQGFTKITFPDEIKNLEDYSLIYVKNQSKPFRLVVPKDCFKAIKILTNLRIKKCCGIRPSKFIFVSSKDSLIPSSLINELCSEATLNVSLSAVIMKHFTSNPFEVFADFEGLTGNQRNIFYVHMGREEKIDKQSFQPPAGIKDFLNIEKFITFLHYDISVNAIMEKAFFEEDSIFESNNDVNVSMIHNSTLGESNFSLEDDSNDSMTIDESLDYHEDEALTSVGNASTLHSKNHSDNIENKSVVNSVVTESTNEVAAVNDHIIEHAKDRLKSQPEIKENCLKSKDLDRNPDIGAWQHGNENQIPELSNSSISLEKDAFHVKENGSDNPKTFDEFFKGKDIDNTFHGNEQIPELIESPVSFEKNSIFMIEECSNSPKSYYELARDEGQCAREVAETLLQDEISEERKLSLDSPEDIFLELSGNLGDSETPLKKNKRKMQTNEERKYKRQLGKKYINCKGREVPEKTYVDLSCNCRYKCDSHLPTEERKRIFQQFWGSGNWQTQATFIMQNARCTPVKRRTVSSISRITTSRNYFLNNRRVCKNVFLHCLGITSSRVDYILRKKSKGGISSPDRRGCNVSNKTPINKIRRVKQFLDSLPKYWSHIGDKQYFHPDLSVAKLYDLYSNSMMENNENPIGLRSFYNMFRSYNVAIYIPKKDTCQKCEKINIIQKASEDIEKLNLESELNLHFRNAEFARQDLRKASEMSSCNSNMLCFTFDMERTQPIPLLNTSDAFYKRQLWLYNLRINNRSNNKGYMCLWMENEGKRGSNEVCSSIYEFLQINDLSNIETIHTFSECCPGQSRNKTVISFMKFMCNHFNIKNWEHTFMESGHSYLPNDADFSKIELRKKKIQYLYSIDDWIAQTKMANNKNPLEILRMGNKIRSFDKISKLYYIKNENPGDTFKWFNLKWFKVEQNSMSILYKTSHGPMSEFKTIHLEMKGENNFPNEIPMLLYSGGVNISEAKYKDLQSLLPFIPPLYHDFFNNLSYDSKINQAMTVELYPDEYESDN